MFPYPSLPLSERRSDILQAIAGHQVVLIVGETGSGKTTQLPKMAAEAYALAQKKAPKTSRSRPQIVGCTQPRRLAAVSVARRVAEEIQSPLGARVGYQVRFDEVTSPESEIKFMTDGILLAETLSDPDLSRYHTLIIDEAHERSLNIDFLLGYLKRLLVRRPDLKLLISSATLDALGLSDFFKNAPIIHVEGRTFPVDIYYQPPAEEEELTHSIGKALDWISEVDKKGDILIFLPGEREIQDVARFLEGKKDQQSLILPLFARLGLKEQQRVFTPHPTMRRIVLATNVAETSLTIPGIIYVIDSGLARVSRYSPARQVQRLQIEPISQASAKQRAGRCGRITEGICLRLYEEEDFEKRPLFTDPEIRRSALAAVILRMKALHLPELSDFDLPDPPSSRLITEGYRTLREIGALDKEKELTPLGKKLSLLPMDPRLGRMILEGQKQHCLTESLILVSALNILDPRERPQTEPQKASQAQRRWHHPTSDFLSLLALWKDVSSFKNKASIQRNALRKFCKEHYLNFLRVLEWFNLFEDLRRLLKERLHFSLHEPRLSPEEREALSPALHKSLLAGIPRQIGLWDGEEKHYKSAQGSPFSLFPGSGLFSSKKRPQWIMGVELVETSKLWMRRCAVLNPLWVEEVAPHLCQATHYEAHWDKAQGAVYAKERVLCGGLPLVVDRRVHFGRIAPQKAREIFIEEALLGHKLRQAPAFLKQLEKEEEKVRLHEIRTRKPDQFWCREAVLEFLHELLPPHCCTEKSLHQWTQKEGKNTRLFPLIGHKKSAQTSSQTLESSTFEKTEPREQNKSTLPLEAKKIAPSSPQTKALSAQGQKANTSFPSASEQPSQSLLIKQSGSKHPTKPSAPSHSTKPLEFSDLSQLRLPLAPENTNSAPTDRKTAPKAITPPPLPPRSPLLKPKKDNTQALSPRSQTPKQEIKKAAPQVLNSLSSLSSLFLQTSPPAPTPSPLPQKQEPKPFPSKKEATPETATQPPATPLTPSKISRPPTQARTELSPFVYPLWQEYPLEDFPTKIHYQEIPLEVYYALDRGAPDDGVSLGVALKYLSALPSWLTDWGVKGWLAPRVEYLLRELPKDTRDLLPPLRECAEEFAALYGHGTPPAPLSETLCAFLQKRAKHRCFFEPFDLKTLPYEYQIKVSVLNPQGKEIAFGLEIEKLKEDLAEDIQAQFEKRAAQQFSLSGLTDWTAPKLPLSVPLGVGEGFVALVDEGSSVGVKVFALSQEADFEHRKGCARLFSLKQGSQVSHLQKNYPLSLEAKLSLSVLGKAPRHHASDILLLAIEGALGKTLPRCAKSFAQAELHARQNLFSCAKVVAQTLELLVTTQEEVQQAILEQRNSRFGGRLATDLEEYWYDWLLRPEALLRRGYFQLGHLQRYAQGMQQRLQRLRSQPLAKELERLDKIEPYHRAWKQALERNPTSFELEDFGQLLDEFRLALFAPSLPTRAKISPKVLEDWISAHSSLILL